MSVRNKIIKPGEAPPEGEDQSQALALSTPDGKVISPAADQYSVAEQVVLMGDLTLLSPEQRVDYYRQLCLSLKLNPLSRPFEYLLLKNRLTLYANKECAAQLRHIHGVSIISIEKVIRDGIVYVTAHAKDAEGRTDIDLGTVCIDGMRGQEVADAILKAITKAKRRVTLSICGLGHLDESEIEGIHGARRVAFTEAESLPEPVGEPFVPDTAPTAQNGPQRPPAASPEPVQEDVGLPQSGSPPEGQVLSEREALQERFESVWSELETAGVPTRELGQAYYQAIYPDATAYPAGAKLPKFRTLLLDQMRAVVDKLTSIRQSL